MTLALSASIADGAPRSRIKPQLVNLSGSGASLEGLVIERDLERPHAGVDGGYTGSPKHVIVIHSRNRARLDWLSEGRRRQAVFSAGDAIVNPAGLFIAPRWSADVELLLLGVDPGYLNIVAEGMDHPGAVELRPRVQFRDELLEQLARALIAEFERPSPPDRLYAESVTHTLIAHLLRHHSSRSIGTTASRLGRGLSPRTLARVIDYIQAHLDGDLSLKQMAATAGISPSRFLALFKWDTGLAPHQYVIAQRVEAASALLRHTSLPIAQIATRTGFADQSHLTRLMRRHTGLTPRLVRRG